MNAVYSHMSIPDQYENRNKEGSAKEEELTILRISLTTSSSVSPGIL